jgi:Na+/H+ antiporter NhaC
MHAYGLWSLAPIVVAIGLALWTKEIILALGAGVLLASFILQGGHPWAALVYTVDPLIVDAIADRDHVVVTMFTLLIAATIEILNRGRGTHALVGLVTRRATTRRSGQLATWGAGMVVFFDDYANCLIVGSSMKALTDRLRVSREKLAYLVDSTAAPMATLALVSTWIGYEVSLMDDALVAAGVEIDAYAFFIQGIPYRFYPILALVFGLAISLLGRDFGPMHAAEQRAQLTPVVEDPAAASTPTYLAWLAAIPIGSLLGVTGSSLWIQGTQKVGADAKVFEIVAAADGYAAMLHGAIAAIVLACVLAVAMRALPLAKVSEAAVDGIQAIVPAFIVLFLAWSMGKAIGELDAAGFLVSALGPTLPVWSLPTVVFVLAAAIAFATGTSFGTMAVLVPLAIPLAFAIDGGSMTIALATSASVLSGATWGDHCSPISDTTVLSSTGAGCDHAAHVETQMPYALAAGAVSILFGTLPAGFGVSPVLLLIPGAIACFAIVWLLGRPVVAQPTSDVESLL